MTTLTARQAWRRARTATVREERTITAYIRAKYPKIYCEAANFYNALNERHPHKADLRKLPEFHALTLDIPSKKTKKYATKEYPYIPEGFTNQENTEQTKENPNMTDNMQLRIELLQMQASKVQESAEDTTTPQASEVQESAEDTTTPQASEDTTTPQASEVQEPASYLELGEIDYDTIDKIVRDLQNDPEILNFFEDIEIDQLSPLEAELLIY